MYSLSGRLLMFLMLAFTGSVFSQQSFTLQQAIEYGLQNQVNVKNARLDEELAKAKKNEIRGIGLPQINGSVDIKNFPQIPTTLIPGDFSGMPGTFIPVKFGTEWNATVGADASWLLLDGSYFVGLQGARVYMDLAKKNSQRTRTDVAVEIMKAYYGYLIAVERMNPLQANIDRLKKLKDDTQVMYDNGFVEKLDLDRIDVAYTNLLVEKDKIIRLIELSKNLLKFQMGYDINAEIVVADKLDTTPFVEPGDDKIDVKNRIEYQLMETQVKAGRLLLQAERAKYFPNVILYMGANTVAMRQEFSFLNSEKWYPTVVVGGKLNVPIFSGGIRKYKVDQAKINLMKNENQKTFVEQSLNLELSNARTILKNSAATLDAQRKNIVLSEEVYRVSKLKYEQGVGANLDVLIAQTALKEAQTNYYNALYAALIAKVDYDKASGTISK